MVISAVSILCGTRRGTRCRTRCRTRRRATTNCAWRLRRTFLAITAASVLCAFAPPTANAETLRVGPERFLAVVDSLLDRDGRFPASTTLLLEPGTYELRPFEFIEPLCGNCEDPETNVTATVGLRVSGDQINIRGAGYNQTVLVTGAGYGILFEDCRDCRLTNLTVTGGQRDPDPNATDAAVVVRRSRVTVDHCRLADNLGSAELIEKNIVGIMGLAGREEADVTVTNCVIKRNSWDGIALYRGARGKIDNNIIDGVDKAGGRVRGGGRGVGIGVTWDARALIRHNLVARYWKGIGVFLDGQADVFENVIEEMLTWGIAYWDAGSGKPFARISRNIVYDTGACGISITRSDDSAEDPGFCSENIVALTGQNEKYDDPEYYCAQCPIAMHAVPAAFRIRRNLLYDNRRALDDTSSALDWQSDVAENEIMDFVAGLRDLQKVKALRGARCFDELTIWGKDQQ